MAHHGHKRDTARLHHLVRSRTTLVALPVAAGMTLGALVLGGTLQGGAEPAPSADASSQRLLSTSFEQAVARAASAAEAADAAPRRERLSRGSIDRSKAAAASARLARTRAAVRAATAHRWATADLNLWSTSGEDARKVGLVDAGDKVLVTGRSANGRVELAVKGASRWVTAGYLADEKPKPKPAAPAVPAGLSSAPCPDGSVENGLTPGAVAVYRAVCHAFPQITTYGGYDAHGEHASGKALDIMTSDVTLGTQIAEFLRSHASELGLFDVIWRQRIWTPERASEGWRTMESRGSATADHYDHVHVAVS